jgi:hypothetical protein
MEIENILFWGFIFFTAISFFGLGFFCGVVFVHKTQLTKPPK